MIELLNELEERLNKNLENKSSDLLKRIKELQETDDKEQVDIDELKLLANNQITINEKIQAEIHNLTRYKVEQEVFDQEGQDIRDIISKIGSG